MKLVLCIVGLLAIIGITKVRAAGECGKNTTPDMEAFKLVPCASAVQDPNAAVSDSCCAVAKPLAQNPACMCAVLMSNIAKMSGVKPEYALSIPKRCNMANRSVGYKCGSYTFP